MRQRIHNTLICGLLALLLCACGSGGAGASNMSADGRAGASDMSADGGVQTAEDGLPEGGTWFRGWYLRAKNADMIIFEDGYNSPAAMGTANETVSFEGVTDGDVINIYLFEIMETWPGQTVVYAVEKLEDGEFEDIPSDTLEQLREYGWIE